MRLIDADALIKENAYASDMWDGGTQSFDLPIVEVRDIEDAPSIDIVFCKECRHRGICFGRLVQGNEVVQLNFCSYGERREP